MSVALIDATNSSLTVSWPGKASEKFVLQYRKGDTDDESSFQTLSESLPSTQARKKHLEDSDKTGFVFRAKAVSDQSRDGAWLTHEDPFYLLTDQEEAVRLPPPTVSLGGTNLSLLVQWKAATSQQNKGYELQMRENTGGDPWKTIAACISGTEARKKNLTSPLGYQFRVRSVAENDKPHPFSSPSEPSVALGLSSGIKSLFKNLEKGTLLRSPHEAPVLLEDALGGKEFVLLYASAHWCGPCRQATPQIDRWYQSLGGANKTIEVVFLSADRDTQSFQDYYKSMPWLAVDFDDDTREELMGFIQVKGIPQLAVLDGRSGRIIEQNAVGKSFDVSRWRSLAASTKK
jgi:nucleoredoxin